MRESPRQTSAQAVIGSSGATTSFVHCSLPLFPLSSADIDIRIPAAIPVPVDRLEDGSNTETGAGNPLNTRSLVKPSGAEAPALAVRHQYQPGDVKFIRDATRLSAKFFGDKRDPIWADRQLRLCNHSFDIGLILSLAGESKDLIVAGILSSSFQETLKEDRAKVKGTIERKFGSHVLSLIEEVSSHGDESRGWLSRAFDLVIKQRVTSQEVASLDCAIKIAILTTANKLIEKGLQRMEWPAQIREASLFKDEQAVTAVNESIVKYEEQGVSPQLIKQLKIEIARFNGEPSDVSDAVGLSEVDALANTFRDLPAVFIEAQLIRSAAELSSELFDAAERKWGPHETLPLTAHEFEVGILLALSGARKEIVIAGFLHDLFEGYVEIDRVEIRDRVESTFGGRVLELIDSVTEPPKSNQASNWWNRKRAVLNQILKGDSDMATLSCATKISTISAGNKFLRFGSNVNEWSRGTFQANVTVFEQHLKVYKRKKVPEGLIHQYAIELNIFKQGSMVPAEYHILKDSMAAGA